MTRSGLGTTRRDVMAAVLGGVLLGARRLDAQAAQDRASLIEDLVAANRILYAQNVVDAYGHVSVRVAPKADRYLLARAIPPEQVTAGDIVEWDLDSKAINDTRGGYRERFIHGEIYKVRPDVMAIVHGHAPALIPFGITKTPLQAVYHQSSFIGEGIPVFEIRDTAGDSTDLLVSSPELGKALAKTLGNKPAALMRGHGAVVVAGTLIDAVARSVYLEINARIQAEAMKMGGPVTYLSPGEVKKRTGDEDYSRPWALWKKALK